MDSNDERDPKLARTAQFATFATLGVIGTAQDLVSRIRGNVEGVDPELIAEETLCLIATTTARAATAGLQAETTVLQAVLPYILELPYMYRDYLVAGAIIREDDTSLLNEAEAVYQRLEKKMSFYTTHFPEGNFPSEEELTEKMELWMGRVSPPGLSEPPEVRLKKLRLVPPLLTQLKLVLAFGRRGQMG